MNQESDNSERVVTFEGSLRPSCMSRAVPSSMARPESGVAATVREFADDVVGGDPVCKDEGLMMGVGDKRRRRDAEDMLDKESDVPAADLDDFVDRMSSMELVRGSAEWARYWREHAEVRLEHLDPTAWIEYLQKRADEGDAERQERKEPRREAEEATDGTSPEEAPDTSAQREEDVEHEDDWEGWIDLEDGSEEARLNRMCRPCNPPSADMIRQHDLSHCQYRSWCSICVQAAADDRPHVARPDGSDDGPEVHSDYAFFRNKRGDKVHMPVLISKNRKTKSISAHVVPKKGTGGGWIVQQYLRDLRKQGLRGKLTLRSDGEPAIRSLLDRVADLRGGETILENSPVGDSRANG